jgi:acyl-CoA thioester hydrolase
MTRAFTRRFKVREYELDSFGHVNHAVYIKYLQEAAIEASADAGYDMDWYKAAGTQWVIRKLTARYHTPALYGDELEVTTWVSDLRRVRSQREYDVRRVSDGQRVLRARHDWVYMDMSTDRPRTNRTCASGCINRMLSRTVTATGVRAKSKPTS